MAILHDILYLDIGWSPLHEACNHGHVKIAAILLDNEAFVNALGMDGDTPLHDAVNNSHIEVTAN